MSASGIPVQSKLEPYFDLIVASRRRRKTWAQIAELIKDRGTSISRQRLVIFFKTRKKRHRALSNEAEIHEKSATTQNPTARVEWPNGESAIGNKLLARHVPQTHAKPYQSPLWKHLETIRTLRRKRETWAMIALHLEDAHGLKVSKSTVFKFFQRATSGRVPLGFGNIEATRDLQKPIPAAAKLREPVKPFEESNNDPFSIEATPLDPWKPRSATHE